MRWKLWIVAGVAVVMGASATRAENWLQMDPNNPVYYDADSIFVDAATGYIVTTARPTRTATAPSTTRHSHSTATATGCSISAELSRIVSTRSTPVGTPTLCA